MQVCPSLLIKKDRGRPTDPKARPKAYGEVDVVSDVPGVELLQADDNNEGDVSDTVGSTFSDSDDDHENYEISAASDNEENQLDSDVTGSEDDEVEDDDDSDASGDGGDDEDDDEEEEEVEEKDMEVVEVAGHEPNGSDITNDDAKASETGVKESKGKKRKSPDFDGKLLAADASLQALKRLAGVTMGRTSSDSTDGILSNEDFRRIKELKVS